GDSFLKFGNSTVFGIHRWNSTLFRHLTKDQFQSKMKKCRERVLKKSVAKVALFQQPSYADPTLPIHEDLIPCITEFIFPL
ncbi:MAG: hypothetical protein LBI05_09390, partial [Planctomycetaceae bacterium]|nr:hypothetical protein [Planctomycetaceae bacterium]